MLICLLGHSLSVEHHLIACRHTRHCANCCILHPQLRSPHVAYIITVKHVYNNMLVICNAAPSFNFNFFPVPILTKYRHLKISY